MDRALRAYGANWAFMPERFSMAPSPPTCRSSSRPDSSWSSIARPRRRSASPCRPRSWPAPTRSSNDGVDGPLRHLGARMMVGETHHRREPSMGEVTTIGLDLAKHVFQVHGVDASGATVLRKQLRRSQVVAFFAGLPRCLVGLEACATAHDWARELQAVGHEVRLMPAQYVKAYMSRPI